MSNPTLQFPRDGELRVTAWSGSVLIDGPDGIALTFSPDVAEDMCRSIAEAVKVARSQRMLDDNR